MKTLGFFLLPLLCSFCLGDSNEGSNPWGLINPREFKIPVNHKVITLKRGADDFAYIGEVSTETPIGTLRELYVSKGGVLAGPYTKVDNLTFSPNGRAIAYDCEMANINYVFFDNKRLVRDRIFEGHWSWTPDSKTLQFESSYGTIIASRSNSFRGVRWSPDHMSFAFLSNAQSMGWFIVSEKFKIGPLFTREPIIETWSSDSKTILYAVESNEYKNYFLNGEPIASSPTKNYRVPSPDLRVLAFEEKISDEKFYLTLGPYKVGPFKQLCRYSWSPDGKSLAYWSQSIETGEWHVNIGPRQLGPYSAGGGHFYRDFIGSIVWSDDKSSVSYSYIGKDGLHIFRGSQHFGPYKSNGITPSIRFVTWSPFGTKFALMIGWGISINGDIVGSIKEGQYPLDDEEAVFSWAMDYSSVRLRLRNGLLWTRGGAATGVVFSNKCAIVDGGRILYE